MSRETKINLVFIIVFVTLVIPGGLRLFYKKLYEEVPRPIDLRSPRKVGVAYVDPAPQDPAQPRVVPAAVEKWLTTLSRQAVEGTDDVLAQAELSGQVSQLNRVFEPVTLLAHRETATLWVLVWRPELLSDPAATAEVAAQRSEEADFEPISVAEVSLTDQAVPKPVRQGLQAAGYIDPPPRVGWLRLKLSESPSGAKRVRVTLGPDRVAVDCRWGDHHATRHEPEASARGHPQSSGQ